MKFDYCAHARKNNNELTSPGGGKVQYFLGILMMERTSLRSHVVIFQIDKLAQSTYISKRKICCFVRDVYREQWYR